MTRSRPPPFLAAVALLISYVLAQTNSYVCPGNTNTAAYDATTGIGYYMRCSADTDGSTLGTITTTSAPNDFNDCFNACSTRANCAAFTYAGGANGVGGGTCYLKSLNNAAINGTFLNGGTNVVSGIRLSNYPPIPPKYTCPLANDRTVVTDPNVGTQYVLSCNMDTANSSPWSVAAADSFNDCFSQCSSNAISAYGACTGFTYQSGSSGTTYGVGQGVCYMKTGNSEYFQAPAPDTPYKVGAIQLAYYNNQNGAPYFDPTTMATYFPPAATQLLTQTKYITQTLLQAFPFTVFSTVTSLTTITSSLTLTATRLLTLSDATQIITNVQVVPTTIITIQVQTLTITRVTTQQLVTAIPTTIVQTVFGSTVQLINTATNIQTTVLQPVVTVAPSVQSVRGTVTVSIGG